MATISLLRSVTVAWGQTMPPEFPDNFTPMAQQVVTLAREEADGLHHGFVGTEHLLLEA